MLCTPLYPMVLLIRQSLLNGYFIGNINPTFSDKPTFHTASISSGHCHQPVQRGAQSSHPDDERSLLRRDRTRCTESTWNQHTYIYRYLVLPYYIFIYTKWNQPWNQPWNQLTMKPTRCFLPLRMRITARCWWWVLASPLAQRACSKSAGICKAQRSQVGKWIC